MIIITNNMPGMFHSRQVKICMLLLGLCLSNLSFGKVDVNSVELAAQIHQVTHSTAYRYGEGISSTIEQAKSIALEDMVTKINSIIRAEATFQLVETDTGINSSFSRVNQLKSTLRLQNISYLTRQLKGKDFQVYAYILQSDLDAENRRHLERIVNFYNSAMTDLELGKLGDALRKLYWANLISSSVYADPSISFTIDGKKTNSPALHLPEFINKILDEIKLEQKDVTISSDSASFLLSVTYHDKPVEGLEFQFNNREITMYPVSVGGFIRLDVFQPEVTLITKLQLSPSFAYENLMKTEESISDLYTINKDRYPEKWKEVRVNFGGSKSKTDPILALPITKPTYRKTAKLVEKNTSTTNTKNWPLAIQSIGNLSSSDSLPIILTPLVKARYISLIDAKYNKQYEAHDGVYHVLTDQKKILGILYHQSGSYWHYPDSTCFPTIEAFYPDSCFQTLLLAR